MANEVAQADVLELSRIIDAPRALVFKAWTEAEHLAQWFGPWDVSLPFCRTEPRPGGLIHFCHHHGDTEIWVKGSYREFVAPERLVFGLSFVDAGGRPAAHPMFPDWPKDTVILTTVTFADRAGKTELNIRQVLQPPAAASDAARRERDAARVGWKETLERLVEHVAATQHK